MTIYEKLNIIQLKLRAPKDLKNKFGGFNYRSAESILENIKPLLLETKTALTLSDEVVYIGDRYYIKATATLNDCESENSITTYAYAREDEEFKGMSLGQLSGSTCSYARKYALCGLFAIDNGNDLDSLDTANLKVEKPKVDVERDVLLAQVNKLQINLTNGAHYLGKDVKDLTNEDLKTLVDMKEKAKK